MTSDSRPALPLLGVDCPCSGATLDRLVRPAILALLAAGPQHGYQLVRRLGRMPLLRGHAPDASGVYRHLRSMAEQGLVAATWETSSSGPAKRVYAVTDEGRACLRRWADTLDAYQRGLRGLVRAARAACAAPQEKKS